MGRTSKRKRKKRQSRFIRNTILSLAAISAYSLYNHSELVGFVNKTTIVEKATEIVPIEPEIIVPKVEASRIDFTKVKSPNVILIDYQTGETVAEKGSTERIFPASLTKIMTVLVALDHVVDLNQKVKMEEAYFEGLYEARASITGFVEDEVTTVRELLYGAILPSGADACLALAYLIAGSEAEFVILMNEKAEELGLSHTYYTNATGLHDVKNISSVADIATLTHGALQNPVFYEIFTTLQHEVAPTNINEEGFLMNSTVFNSLLKYPELTGTVIGGKTGFTEQAGLCLASIGQVDGKKYLLITAGAEAIPDFPIDQDRHIEEPIHIQDAENIYRQLMEETNHVSDH